MNRSKTHVQTQLPKCLYQPVQGVVDLMDARQCSQVRIQLKVWFNTIQKRLNSQSEA